MSFVSDNVAAIIIICSICVVLPIMIAWLKTRRRTNETNKRTEVLLAAIEKNATIDTEALTKMMTENKKPASTKGSLHGQLTGGLICSFIGMALLASHFILNMNRGSLVGGSITFAVGLALILCYLIGMKTFSKEIEAEEKNMRKAE